MSKIPTLPQLNFKDIPMDHTAQSPQKPEFQREQDTHPLLDSTLKPNPLKMENLKPNIRHYDDVPHWVSNKKPITEPAHPSYHEITKNGPLTEAFIDAAQAQKTTDKVMENISPEIRMSGDTKSENIPTSTAAKSELDGLSQSEIQNLYRKSSSVTEALDVFNKRKDVLPPEDTFIENGKPQRFSTNVINYLSYHENPVRQVDDLVASDKLGEKIKKDEMGILSCIAGVDAYLGGKAKESNVYELSEIDNELKLRNYIGSKSKQGPNSSSDDYQSLLKNTIAKSHTDKFCEFLQSDAAAERYPSSNPEQRKKCADILRGGDSYYETYVMGSSPHKDNMLIHDYPPESNIDKFTKAMEMRDSLKSTYENISQPEIAGRSELDNLSLSGVETRYRKANNVAEALDIFNKRRDVLPPEDTFTENGKEQRFSTNVINYLAYHENPVRQIDDLVASGKLDEKVKNDEMGILSCIAGVDAYLGGSANKSREFMEMNNVVSYSSGGLDLQNYIGSKSTPGPSSPSDDYQSLLKNTIAKNHIDKFCDFLQSDAAVERYPLSTVENRKYCADLLRGGDSYYETYASGSRLNDNQLVEGPYHHEQNIEKYGKAMVIRDYINLVYEKRPE